MKLQSEMRGYLLAHRRVAFWFALTLLAYVLPITVTAQIVVSTLGGGPTSFNPSQAGYADGNTFEDSQFNFPQGLALDSAGSIFLADRINGMVRKVTSPGSAGASVTSTFIKNLSQPVAVAIDATNNLYVLTYGDGMLREYDRFGNILATNISGLNHPTALAMDTSGNLFLTEEIGNVRELLGSGQVVLLASGLSSPEGIAVMRDGTVAVSDTGNNAIRLVSPFPAFQAVRTLTGGHGAGFADGATNLAQFNQPYGLAVSPNGTLIVADRFNHRVRTVDDKGITATLYGIDQSGWTNTFPGWFDGTVGVDPVAAREPVGVTVALDGIVYVTEDYWQILREATGGGAMLGNAVVTTNGTNFVTIVTPPSFSPSSGYFPMGTTITVTSLYSTVYYTTDGSTPTTNSTPLTIINGVGTIHLLNGSGDLTLLEIVAFNGTNASVIVSGLPPPVNQIGLSRDVSAGPGAGIYLPISVNLRPKNQIKSFLFRLEIAPVGGAPVITNIQAANITTNDFVPLPVVSPGGVAAQYTFEQYQAGVTNGVVVSAVGTNSNFIVQNSSVLSLLYVQIPGDATPGQTYSVTMITNSATSDGFAATLPVAPMPPRTITVASIGYLVGDTSPHAWYNAGDFGDGNLDISDVDNAFYASLGIFVPYQKSDAFDAMDAFPVDQPGIPGGDGQIRFLDWQIIRLQSLGVFGTNWMRAWVNPGVRTNWVLTTNFTPLSVSGPGKGGPAKSLDSAAVPESTRTAPAPGNVWFRQAVFGSAPPPVTQPGATCVVPIYVKILPGYSLAGLQFRASVVADGGGPSPAISFSEGQGIPNPIQAGASSLGANELALAWSLGAFPHALTGSNLLGYLQFSVPAGAPTNQTYSIHYSNEDGAPNLQTQYDFEALTGVTGIGVPASIPASITSDEWKLHFFGSTTNAMAMDGADPDGDGVPNWMEYLAGTNPTNAASKLALDYLAPAANGGVPGAFTWLSAPGKSYVIESAASLISPNWTALVSNIAGDGTMKTFPAPAVTAGANQFYRVRLQP